MLVDITKTFFYNLINVGQLIDHSRIEHAYSHASNKVLLGIISYIVSISSKHSLQH